MHLYSSERNGCYNRLSNVVQVVDSVPDGVQFSDSRLLQLWEYPSLHNSQPYLGTTGGLLLLKFLCQLNVFPHRTFPSNPAPPIPLKAHEKFRKVGSF